MKPDLASPCSTASTFFNLLCVPGETDVPTITDLQSYCYTHRAFLIVDAPQLGDGLELSKLSAEWTLRHQHGWKTLRITGPYTSSSAYYYPWILAPDPAFGNRPRYFRPAAA